MRDDPFRNMLSPRKPPPSDYPCPGNCEQRHPAGQMFWVEVIPDDPTEHGPMGWFCGACWETIVAHYSTEEIPVWMHPRQSLASFIIDYSSRQGASDGG